MDGDYFELSQFPYNSYSSPLETIGILTSGIRFIDLEMTKSIAIHQAFMKFYFKGGDLFWWLVKLYEFFVVDNTPWHRMVSIASYYMAEEEAWEWFQDLEASGLCTNWVHFICALQDRFQAPIFDASMESTTQECKMQEPTNFMPKDQEPIIKAPMEAPT